MNGEWWGGVSGEWYDPGVKVVMGCDGGDGGTYTFANLTVDPSHPIPSHPSPSHPIPLASIPAHPQPIPIPSPSQPHRVLLSHSPNSGSQLPLFGRCGCWSRTCLSLAMSLCRRCLVSSCTYCSDSTYLATIILHTIYTNTMYTIYAIHTRHTRHTLDTLSTY